MYSCCQSYGVLGIEAHQIQVEADISRAMPSFDVVGLPDAAEKEARDRVRSAMANCGLVFPTAKVVLNLAPAALRKTGALYDVPIFLSILSAQKVLPPPPASSAFLGELSLSGEIRPVRGVLPMVLQAQKDGITEIYVPIQNAKEGAVVQGIRVFGVEHISQLLAHLQGEASLHSQPPTPMERKDETYPLDLKDVRGQPVAKRALEVAAAGGHNLLLIGPPGTGKSMLAKRLPTILPPLSFQEAVETTKIYSVAGLLGQQPMVVQRPFRAPHHTVSPAGLSGGGSSPVPGEISLAHNGVLFLDELPEFGRQSIEVLRQPMEDGEVTISRAHSRVTYPCSVMVVAAMNPCPCGYLGHPTVECTCQSAAVERYLAKISGPLLDRMDIQVEAAPLDYEAMTAEQTPEEASAQVRQRVCAARQVQVKRFAGSSTSCNAAMLPQQMREFCPLAPQAQAMMAAAFDRMGLSGRAYDRILKVARTIADLDDSPIIERTHLAEAIQYRTLDRKFWRR